MDQAQILAAYSAAWNATQRMLQAARAEQWDALIELEQGRDGLLAQLMQAQAPTQTKASVDPQQAAETARLIRNILAADQQIQGLTRAWMDEINGVLGSVQAEKKLLKAYDAF
jgi:flagellar protein FliT